MATHPEIVIAAGIYQVHHRHAAMVAKDRGFFADENLNEVEVITTNHHDDHLGREMQRGNVHFGLDARPQDVLRWITKEKAEIYLIGGYKNRVSNDIVGAKGLKTLKDLKGKRIGVSKAGKSDERMTLDEIQARIVIKSANLDPEKDVEWVAGKHLHPVLADPMVALRNGEVDCVFVRDVEIPKIEEEGYPVLLRFREFYPEGYPERAMIGSGSFMNQYPEVAVAFLKGMIRAHQFIRDMPRNFGFMVALDKRMRGADEDTTEKTADIRLTPEKFARSSYPIDGRLAIKGLEAILAQEREFGNIPESFSLDMALKNEFVEKANKELDQREDLHGEYQRVKALTKSIGY